MSLASSSGSVYVAAIANKMNKNEPYVYAMNPRKSCTLATEEDLLCAASGDNKEKKEPEQSKGIAKCLSCPPALLFVCGRAG